MRAFREHRQRAAWQQVGEEFCSDLSPWLAYGQAPGRRRCRREHVDMCLLSGLGDVTTELSIRLGGGSPSHLRDDESLLLASPLAPCGRVLQDCPSPLLAQPPAGDQHTLHQPSGLPGGCTVQGSPGWPERPKESPKTVVVARLRKRTVADGLDWPPRD
ncbi:hypothetical protein EV126DRAFT_218382 [Verticillium dahliae]|nr:hypothetical protein EV126DRAFT_218382 [Verticillium dahliae]